MEWLQVNYVNILAVVGAVVGLASVIVKLTPTQKDDTIFAKIVSVLEVLSLYNKDGSSGKK
jgi:Na+-transporting NADH:ubiquinone oxidoreductase subunit NqrC